MPRQYLTTRFQKIQDRMRSGRGDLYVVLGTLTGTVVQLITNLIGARYIDQAQMGIFQTIFLIPTYLPFLQLGVFNGMSRNLPIAIGKNDSNQIATIETTAAWLAKAYSILGAVIVLLSFLVFDRKNISAPIIAAYISAMIMAGTDPAFLFLDGIYKSKTLYNSLGAILLKQNLYSLFVSLILVPFGIVGFAVSRAVQNLSRVVLRSKVEYSRLPYKFSQNNIKSLIVCGFPLMISGMIYNIFGVVDRTMTAQLISRDAVGEFYIAGLVSNAIQLVPTIIASQIYPRIAICYGKYNDQQMLRKWVVTSVAVTTLIVVPIVWVSYIYIDLFVRELLPKYESSLEIAKVSILGSLSSIYFPATCVIAVLNANRAYIAIQILVLALTYSLGWLLERREFGTLGIAYAKFSGGFALCLISISYALKITQGSHERKQRMSHK